MKLKVVVDDGLIIVDGQKVKVDIAALPSAPDISNLWAISWDDTLIVPGEMELRNGTANVPFSDSTSVQFFIDAHVSEIAQINAKALVISEDIDLNKSAKLAEMELAARDAILSGFTSSALGSTHTYGGKETDQINLIGSASASVDMVFPCADSSGVWDRRMHTATQLKIVVSDGAVYKQAVLAALDARRLEVANASDLSDVNNIIWIEV